MAASLDILHTAALRLREAADRFVVAFEKAAAEASTEAPETRPAASQHQRKGRAMGAAASTILALAERPQGVTAPEAAKAIDRDTSNTSARLIDLVQRGKLVSVRSNYSSHGRLRYFTTPELAEAWAAEQGPPAVEAHEAPAESAAIDLVGLKAPSDLGPSAPMNGVDIDAVHRRPLRRLAAMVEADAPAVAAALAVIAPVPAPSAPPPKPYIPPTPTRARGERREELTAAAYVAPVAKPTGDTIVPSTAKITIAPTPVDGRFCVDPKTLGEDPESFSAQWARLRGEGSGA
jgi:hypothetical protein